MTQSSIATMADYADAMITARRAKNWIFWILLLMLLAQITMFLVLRYTNITDEAARGVRVPEVTVQGFEALTAVINFLGIALAVVMALVLVLIVVIMLVGRTIGVSRVTSAFVWMVLLTALLFPWQTFLARPQHGGLVRPTEHFKRFEEGRADPVFRIPGVLATWEDMLAARFPNDDWSVVVLKWARFVGFPVLAMVILSLVQLNSSRGLRLALGETDIGTADAMPPA